VVTGAVFTGPIIDFSLPGFLLVRFARSYSSSAVRRQCGMGWGWSNALQWTAEVVGDQVALEDPDGRIALLPLPEDEVVVLPYGRTICRQGADLIVELDDGLQRVLRRVEGDRANLWRLVELRDGSGNFAEIEWRAGEVVGIVDSVGRHARRTADGPWRIWELVVVDDQDQSHRQRLVSYELDLEGQLVRVIDAGGVETRYDYDDEHYLLRETRPDGLVWHFRYAEAGGKKRCVETWGELSGQDVLALLGDPAAGTTAAARGVYHAKLEYGPAPYQSQVEDALGYRHRYWGNALGQVVRYVDPRGVDHVYRYDAIGKLISQTGADGTARQQYDLAGRAIAVTAPDRSSIRSYFDQAQQLYKVKLPSGLQTARRYENGKTVEYVDVRGGTTTTTYNDRGAKASITAPNGATDDIEYDAHGNISKYVTADGAEWTYSWDLYGLPVRLQSPTGASYAIRYGSRGEIVQVTTPTGQKAVRGYDALGRLVEMEHGGGGRSTWRYCADALVEQTLTDGSRWRMGYDALLRIRWLENPAGERHSWDYDACGNVVRETTFAGQVTEYEYDAAERLCRVERGDGSTVAIDWDAAGRIIRRERSDGSVETFAYDRFGKLQLAENDRTTVEFARDELGNLIRECQRTGSWEFAVDYQYNALGQVVGRKYSTGWGIDASISSETGRLEAIEIDGEGSTDRIGFEYDPAGREIARRRSAGAGAILTERNALGLPEKITVLGSDDELVAEREYVWDKKGPLGRIVDPQAGERRFELDELGRPLSVRGLSVNESFAYTPHGTAIAADGSWTMAQAGRPRQAAGSLLEWDERGRLCARHSEDDATASWTYRYDDDSRLIEAVREDGRTVRYSYDALGRRISETCDGASTWFGWEGDAVVEERSTLGKTTYRVFGADGHTPLLEGEPQRPWKLIAHDAASTPWLYIDAEGSRCGIELTTWGLVAAKDGEPGNLRFAGQRADELTGLHYNRNRYYAPDLHVFITPDPAGVIYSPHDIGFVPNATYYLDPLGLLTIIQASDDSVISGSTERLRAANPGATVINASDLTSTSLQGETDVIVNSHGSPGSVTFGNDSVNGQQLAERLNAAGFDGSQPGAQVAVTACNSATPGTNTGSVAQGVANGTGATAFGAQAGDTQGAQQNTRIPLGNGRTSRSGNMGVGSNNAVYVRDGQWVSTTPQGTPSGHGTTGSGASRGQSTVFGN